MFYGQDLKDKRYTSRAHISEMIAMMGPPPLELLKRGRRTAEFLHQRWYALSVVTLNFFKLNLVGQWRGEIPLSSATSLEESEENLDGSNKEAFLRVMRKILQWQPERRQTAQQLLQDPWLNGVATM